MDMYCQMHFVRLNSELNIVMIKLRTKIYKKLCKVSLQIMNEFIAGIRIKFR